MDDSPQSHTLIAAFSPIARVTVTCGVLGGLAATIVACSEDADGRAEAGHGDFGDDAGPADDDAGGADGGEDDGTATGGDPDAPFICGDGVMQGPETCDDGNLQSGDGCDADCGTAMVPLWEEELAGMPGGADTANGVAQAADGGWLVVGNLHDGTSLDGFARRYDANDTLVWSETLEGQLSLDDTYHGAACAPDGSCYAVGAIRDVNGTGSDHVVRRYTPEDTIDWTSKQDLGSMGDDAALAVTVADDGDIIVVGFALGPSTVDGLDGFVRRYAPDGSERWTRYYNGDDGLDDRLSGVTTLPNGDMIVVGQTGVTGQDADAWVLRLNPAGLHVWSRSFNGNYNGEDDLRGVAVDETGITAVGYERDGATPHVLIRRYDLEGEIQWTQRPGPGVAYGAFTDGVDNVYVIGNLHVDDIPTAWSARLDAADGIFWHKTHDPSGVGVSQLVGGYFDVDQVSFLGVGGVERAADPSNPYLARFTP